MSEIFPLQEAGNKGFMHSLERPAIVASGTAFAAPSSPVIQNRLKEPRMKSGNAPKSARVLAAAITLPLAVLRRVIHLPTALVDMMEKHGTAK
jgi:hypothetical protein